MPVVGGAFFGRAIIDDEPCRIPFRFLTWTNLPCWKLKLEWPFSGLRINHPWRCRWFRRCVINGRWSNCRLSRCCFGYWRRCAPIRAASTTSAISAIQPDIEPRRRGWYNSVEDAGNSGKCWMCGNTQSLDHQTAVEWRITHALYIEQMRKH